MKKYKFIILTTVFFTLTAVPVFAADSPSAEELVKMNAAVSEIKALIAGIGAPTVMYSVATSLATSADPEVVKTGVKIEKMADALSSSSGGSTSSFGSAHSGSATIPSGTTSFGSSKTTIPAVTSAIPSGTTTFTVPMSSGGAVSVKTGTAKTKSALEAIKDGPTKTFKP